MKRLLGLALLAMTACDQVPLSNEIPGSRAVVAGWDIGAYDRNGKFSHCAMATPYESGITMIFSMSGDYSWRVAWRHDAWAFKKGQSVDLVIFVDDARPLYLRAEAVMKDMALAELPANSASFDLMRKGHRMTVRVVSNAYTFDLDGTYDALPEVVACTRRYLGVAAAPGALPFGQTVPVKRTTKPKEKVPAEQPPAPPRELLEPL